MTDEEERQLRREWLVSDLILRRKQGFWEKPRNIAILLAVVAAIFGTISFFVGYDIARTPPRPIIIQLLPAQAPQK